MIDIGGTKVIVALVEGEVVLDRARFPSAGAAGPDALVGGILGPARQLAAQAGRGIGSVLVASPGSVDRDRGVVMGAANLPLHDFPLALALCEGLGGARVVLEHDANCGVVGEASYGAGRGFENVAYVTLSTGIGLGAVVEGRLLRGGHGSASELGHVTVVNDGRLCGCGARGCLEAYASGRAIGSLGQELLSAGGGDLLRGGARQAGAVTAIDVVAAADSGDEGCSAILDRAAALIGDAVRLVQRMLDPQVVVLGGGLMKSSSFARRVFAAATPLPLGPATVPIVPAKLGDESVTRGGMRLLVCDLGCVRRPREGKP